MLNRLVQTGAVSQYRRRHPAWEGLKAAAAFVFVVGVIAMIGVALR